MTVGSPRITLRGLFHRRQHELPAEQDSAGVERARRFLVDVTKPAARTPSSSAARRSTTARRPTNAIGAWGSLPRTEGRFRIRRPCRRCSRTPFKVDTWNLSCALADHDALPGRRVGATHFVEPYTIPKYAGWAQDDWKMSQRLTLNLGVRYGFVVERVCPVRGPAAVVDARAAPGSGTTFSRDSASRIR